MAWFKVDDGLAFHPKVIAAGNAAMGLWLRAGAYSAKFETDGRLKFAELSPLSCRKRDIDRLVEVGLWERVDGGIRFKDWADYQPTKAQKDAERAQTRERVNRFRNGVTQPFVTEGVTEGVTVLPSRPVPTRTSTSNDVLAPPTPSEPRNVRLPKDWEPTKEHQERALNAGIDLNVELEKFKAHAGENDRHAKNWNLAFTRWLINAGEYAKRDKARGGRMTYAERQEAHWQSELANAKAFEAKQNQTTLGALGK